MALSSSTWPYKALGAFCILRTFFTIFPQKNLEIGLGDLIHIKINDIVLLFIWLLVSLICAKSILCQYGVLHIESFHQLLHDVVNFDYRRINTKSIGLFILTGMSATYIARMVFFIYTQWSTELAPLFQTLQIYPALLMGIQTLFQGSYLLKILIHPDLKQDEAFLRHHRETQQQFLDHIWLNFTFILHSVCIFTVLHVCAMEPRVLMEMLTGEVVYRLFVCYIFWKLLKKFEDHGRSNTSQVVADEVTAISKEETLQGSESSSEMVAIGKVTL